MTFRPIFFTVVIFASYTLCFAELAKLLNLSTTWALGIWSLFGVLFWGFVGYLYGKEDSQAEVFPLTAKQAYELAVKNEKDAIKNKHQEEMRDILISIEFAIQRGDCGCSIRRAHLRTVVDELRKQGYRVLTHDGHSESVNGYAYIVDISWNYMD